MPLYDSKWRSWVKNNFILKIIRNDYIVCKISNNRTKKTMEKNQSEIIALPILIKEKLWKEFCISHASLGHSGISNTYTNLKTKWANIKQDLIAKFVSRCITCSLHKNFMTKEVEGKPIIAK
ncbi:2806_t:CDS:1, partial [Funneliformis geosporum]